MDLTKFDIARALARAGRKELDEASRAVHVAVKRKEEAVRLFKKDEDRVKTEFFSAGGIELFVHADPVYRAACGVVLVQETMSGKGEKEKTELGRWNQRSPIGQVMMNRQRVAVTCFFVQLVEHGVLPATVTLIRFEGKCFFKEKGRWKQVWAE